MAVNGNIKSHDETYGGFLRWLKFGTVVTLAVTALVIWLIAG